jgi:NitT/TauT family transport system substrate-binding protein
MMPLASNAQDSSAKDAKVSVAIGTWIGFGKAIIAKKKGYFKGLDVELRIIDDGTALIGGLTGKSLDIAQNSIDQFALYRCSGLPAKLLLLTDESAGGDGAVAWPPIESVRDLRGKKVAYTPGPASEYLLATALRANGMTMDDIRVATFSDPSGTLNAFASKQVDAAVTWEPFLDQAAALKGAKRLFTSKDFPNTIIGVFLIRDGVPALVGQRFVEGWQRAEEFLAQNPGEAQKLIADGLALKSEDVQEMEKGDKLLTIADNIRELEPGKAGQSPPVLQLMQTASDYWKSRGNGCPNAPSVADIDSAPITALGK